jgi:hypothetical protein
LRRIEFEAIAERDEELAVGAEGKPRAEMVAATDLGLLPEDDLDIFEAPVAELPARDRGSCGVFAGLRLGEIDEAVLGESGIERHIEKAALTVCDYFGHAFDGLGDDAVFGHNPQASALLRDEHAAIGKKGKTPGLIETLRHRLDLDLSLLGVDRAILAADLQCKRQRSENRDKEERASAFQVTPNSCRVERRLCHCASLGLSSSERFKP